MNRFSTKGDRFCYLVDQLKCPSSEENRVERFAELSTLIPFVKVASGYLSKDTDIPSSGVFWSRVLKRLAKHNEWNAIHRLLLGPKDGPKSPIDRIAESSPTFDISISGLLRSLSDTELHQWGIRLAICLLKRGAALESIVSDFLEPVPVVAVNLAIKTGNIELFKYVTGTSNTVRLQIDNKDKNGDSPLLILLKSGETNTPSGEALYSLLMKYGASVNVRDASGKQPIDYVEPGTRIYDDLRKGANSYKREQMLRTRMDYMTKKADTAEQQRHYESSLKWFENAIALAEDITDVSQEVAILHRRCAGINFLLGKYDNAIRSAEASIVLNASQYKGYIEKGLAQNKLHMSDATKTFSHAVLMITTCMKQSFGETREDLSRKMKIVDDLRCYMSRVIEELVRSSSWNIVKIIVMGEGYVPVKSSPHKNVKEFIQTISTNVHFTEFSAGSIDLAPIVMAPRLDPKSAWLDELALLLIVKGASLESMAPSSNDTPLHAAVRLCVKSGSSWVLKYLLENHEDMTEIRGIQDRSGRTLYHTICETCGAKDANTGLELTNVLLHYKFDYALEDERNRMPTDIRTTPKPISDLLKQKLTDPKCMEECARRQLQMFNYEAAIWTFTQTIDLVEAKSLAGEVHLATLYSERAHCRLQSGEGKQALKDCMHSLKLHRLPQTHDQVITALRVLTVNEYSLNTMVDTFTELACMGHETQQGILSVILRTSLSVADTKSMKRLDCVKEDVWAMTAYSLLLNSDWDTAYRAYQFFLDNRSFMGCGKQLNVVLQPLCNKEWLSKYPWIETLMLFFLRNGSDYKTLSMAAGDTYLHAAVAIAFLTRKLNILNWMLETIVPSQGVDTITDSSGRTIFDMNEYLISPQLHLYLEQFRASTPSIFRRIYQTVSSLLSTVFSIFREEEHHTDDGVFHSKQLLLDEESQAVECQTDKQYRYACVHAEHGRFNEAVAAFVQILLKTDKLHKKHLTEMCLKGIANNASVQDFPKTIKGLDIKEVLGLLKMFVERGKWYQFERLVSSYGEHKHGRRMAQNISVLALIQCKLFDGFESNRLRILKIFLDHEANIDKCYLAIESALEKKEFRVFNALVNHAARYSSLITTREAAVLVFLRTGHSGLVDFLNLCMGYPSSSLYISPEEAKFIRRHIEDAVYSVKADEFIAHVKNYRTQKSTISDSGTSNHQGISKLDHARSVQSVQPKQQQTTIAVETNLSDERILIERMLQKIPSYHEQSTIISTYREVKVTGDADTREVSGAEEMCDILNFEGLAWEVECSSCVWKLFKHRPYYLKRKFILVIHKLASGQWDPPLRKVIKGVRSVEIYEAELSKDARVIWKIRISRMKDTTLYTQVISILDIVFDHDNLRRAIDKVAHAHGKGQECQWTKTLKGIKHQQYLGKRSETYRQPVLYVEEKQAIDASTCELTQLYPLVDVSETTFHIYRFHSFTTSMAKCIIQDNYTAQFPFKLNDEEHVIIKSKPYEPILLLGRSGTGKTTCCLYRLWQNFCSQWNTGNETDELSLTKTDMLQTSLRENTERPSSPSRGQCGSKRPGHLHQIFVTKNHVLCAEIKKQFTELYYGQNNTMPHGSHNCGPLPSKLKDVTDVSFPLFLTSKQLLLMLDASLDPPHFFERNEDGSLRENIEGWKDEVDVLDDTVVDVDDSQSPRRSYKAKHANHSRFITFEVFEKKIWPNISQKSCLKMQPSLVWTEILSLIKGSFEAMSKQDGHLTLDEYIDIGRKKSPFFSGERDVVYAIYMKYKRFIRKEAMFDETDVVFDIYKRCKAGIDMPWTIHQLYVDETQDFTQAELLLLMSISQNPNDIFLTGDTAQCIMRGIAFRFCDIQACFHHVRECSSAEAKSQINVPKIQKLIFNYRSHSGILSLASSVLDIMTEYFKESFDSLEKDVGLFHGKRPLLLECCSSQDLEALLKKSRESKDTGQGSIIFGSHQAILVANQEAKATLPTVFKENANVLTICECKGLEFDDVLLYNFFKDSQVTKEWRVVISFQDSLGLDSTGDDLRALEFDTLKHKLLNSELKYLYTALTRARCNLWIYDEDKDKRAPMFEYFKARKLVKVVSGKFSDTSAKDGLEFTKASSAKDWVQQGDTFMTHRLYMDAAKCYRRAGDNDKKLSAIAYNKAAIAMTESDEAKRKSYFLLAAADFLKCNKITKAGTCLRYADEYVLSGLAYEKNGKYAAAARMYRQGGDYEAERRCRDLKRCFQNP